MTDTLSEIVSVEDLESILGDDEQSPDEVAHIIKRDADGVGAGILIAMAKANGTELEALCGHRWVPVYGLAPDRLAPCKACVKIWESNS